MMQKITSFYANNEGVAAAVVVAVKLLDELTPPRRLTADTLESIAAIMPVLEVVVRGDFRKVRRYRVSSKLCGAVCGMYAVFGDVLQTEELTAEQWMILQAIRAPLDNFAEQMDRMKPPLCPGYQLTETEGSGTE